jgi:hypothetical protein
MIPFSEVWERIAENAGKVFYTKRRLKFTFRVNEDTVITDRMEHPLTRKDVMAAYRHVPLEGPRELTGLVRGESYVWAILHDRRIRQKDW